MPAGVVMGPVAPSQKFPAPCPSDCADCAVHMACCLGPVQAKRGIGRGREEGTGGAGSGAEGEPVLSSGQGRLGKEERSAMAPDQLPVFRATALTLEAGIVFHSIFIGIALGTSRDVTNLQGLTIALLFHQVSPAHPPSVYQRCHSLFRCFLIWQTCGSPSPSSSTRYRSPAHPRCTDGATHSPGVSQSRELVLSETSVCCRANAAQGSGTKPKCPKTRRSAHDQCGFALERVFN